MNAEIKVGPEKLGQAALHSRGLEDSRRLPRQGHNTHFKMKSCKALTRRGRAGRGGKKDAPAAVGRPQAWCPARRGDRFSSALASTLAPSLGTRNSSSAAKPGSLGWLDAAERRKAFFKYPGVSSLLLLFPIRLSGSLRLVLPSSLGAVECSIASPVRRPRCRGRSPGYQGKPRT